MNGDGKADACIRMDYGMQCYFSNGHGWDYSYGFDSSNFISSGFLHPFNGSRQVSEWSSIRLVDVNGDGIPDPCMANHFTYTTTGLILGKTGLECYLTVGKPELLISVNNELGSSLAVQYSNSIEFSNTYLPLPLQTLSEIDTDDGKGNFARTFYSYSGGFYNIQEKDFRGFNYAKVVGPKGPNSEQKITETWFHQGNDTGVDANHPSDPTGYLKGRPYRIRISDSSGNILVEETFIYTPDADNAAPYFTPVQEKDTTINEPRGVTPSKQTRTVYTYDINGNMIREDHYGDSSDTSVDFTVSRSFSSNTSNWMVGFPLSEITYQGIGTASSNQVSESGFYYDSVTDCNSQSLNQIPTKGNLTRVSRWLSGGTNPETRMAYDNYGNAVCIRDANGNIKTVSYDSTFSFPKIETNPLGQQNTTQYYGIDGIAADKGNYGQVKSVTDPNGAIVTFEYEPLGRISKKTLPDFWTQWFYIAFGDPSAQNIKIDTSIGLSSWKYFDGLGRTILEKKTGPDNKIIDLQTQYNNTGTISQKSLPYFENLDFPKWTTFSYDSLGRTTQINNPDGTTVSYSYGNWETWSLDPNKHQKHEARDAWGRLVKVDEYTGSYGQNLYATTTYAYNVLGNLRFVTDTKGNQTEIRYDTLGRKIYMRDPDMGTWVYTYDVAGNLKTQTDAKGQLTSFTYDSLNRVKTKTVQTITPPTIPTNLVATAASQTQVNLTWTASTSSSSTISGYDIWRSVDRNLYTKIGMVTTTSYSSSGLIPSTTYYYYIIAVDNTNTRSFPSAVASATTFVDTTAPVSPSNLTVSDVPGDHGGALKLSWTLSTSTSVTQQHLFQGELTQ